MRHSQIQNLAVLRRIVRELWIIGILLTFACAAMAQQKKKDPPAKAPLTGHYEGTAKNEAGEIIPVQIDLVEKEDSLSGNISSSHGDFAISGGSHQGENVTLNFAAGDVAGSINLKLADDKLSGTWAAGDDGGPVEVKKTAAQDKPKDKS